MINETERLNKILAVQQKLLQGDLDLSAFMDLVVNEIQALTPANGVIIELASGNEMVYRAACGTAASFLDLRLPLDGSISGLCVKTGEILRSDDTENDPRVNLEACRKVCARSLIVAPLTSQGSTVGVLKIMSDKVNAFGDIDIQLLQLMAGFLGIELNNQIVREIRNFF